MCALAFGPLETQKLIGRTREKEIIRAAVEADQDLRVIYLIGEAGIGKTRLLKEVPVLIEESTARDRCVYGGLFDLYHVDIHTNSGIEMAIAEALDPKKKNKYFAEYRTERRRFERLRKAGVAPEQLENLRQKLGGLFTEAFNRLTDQRRVVLCFDTVELVQYEEETVYELFAISRGGVEVRKWLSEHIPQMQNAVVILAGRPRTLLWTDLQGRLAERLGAPLALDERSPLPADFQQAGQVAITVGPLDAGFAPDSHPETAAYFADLAEQNERIRRAELCDEHYADIYRVTQGKPLHLAFIATLIARDERLPGELLEDLRDQSEEQVKEQMLMAVWRLSSEIEAVLPYVAWLRKGVNAALLSQVLTDRLGNGWKQGRCRRTLADLRELPFVKTREGSPLVFLHDEMYDLMDKYVLSGGDYALDKAKVCQIADKYYEGKIDKAKGRKRQDLVVERLYYQLLANPMRGFNQYRTLSDEAIIAHEAGFDMSLRDEMLRFFEQRGPRVAQEQIARDSAIRWVKRFISVGDNLRAVEVAEKIRTSEHPLFQGYQHPEDTGDPYFTAALLTYQGEALAYLGRYTEAMDALRQAISLLEPVPAEEDYQSWNKAHILGRAHNDLGYIHTREGKFTNALAEYDKALEYFRSSEIASLEASTLKNKAMSLARQGKLLLAREFAKEAEDIFRSLSMYYGEALTLNTRGLIELQTEEPREAEPLCEEALRIFTYLEDARGIGLASIGLGWALRKKGGLAPRYSKEVDQSFKEAETLLRRTVDIFTKEEREPIRLVEAYGQLGRLYRDQANLYRETGVGKPEEIGRLEEQAEQNLNTSIELALQHHLVIERADCLEDLAEIYFSRGEYSKAEELLEQSDELIPAEYRITQDRGLPSPEQADPSLWHMLGKNSLLRGRTAFAQELYEKAIEHNILAYLYFELYSVEAVEERYTGWTSASRRILHQLRGLSRETLEHLQHYVKRVAEEYGVSDTRAVDKVLRLLTDALQAVGPGGQAEERGG